MKPQRQRVSAYALIHDSGRLLLCRISSELPRWAGQWTLPGGGLNFGESPEDAMVREVLEETGLRVEPVSIATIDSLHDTSEHGEFHGLRIIYHTRVVSGGLRPEVSGSTDACAWHPLHGDLAISLVDLAETGVHVARQIWPSSGQ